MQGSEFGRRSDEFDPLFLVVRERFYVEIEEF